jgi:cytochrome c556
LASEALPLIWDEFAEYEELSEKLAASSAHLAEVAEGGDPGASRQAFLDMTKDCKACHDKFREKK